MENLQQGLGMTWSSSAKNGAPHNCVPEPRFVPLDLRFCESQEVGATMCLICLLNILKKSAKSNREIRVHPLSSGKKEILTNIN